MTVRTVLMNAIPIRSTRKPLEIYEIIERFCLGKKRLELFGEVCMLARHVIEGEQRYAGSQYPTWVGDPRQGFVVQ